MKPYFFGAGLLLILTCALIAAPANAQGYGGMHGGMHHNGMHGNMANSIEWNGSVDDRVDVTIHGADVHAHVVTGGGVNDENSHPGAGLPHSAVTVFLRHETGRGRVYIYQQPNARNGFTAGVRIIDNKPGRSNYRFVLGWN